jgi:signal transduction histidine kinase/ligand-binding sensor domain-containing protein
MKHRWNSPWTSSSPLPGIALAISGFLLLLLTGTASALDPHRLISQYAHTTWRVQDGFPNSPQMITQTSDGYIWIAGGGGLLRFDGVTMTPLVSQKSFPTDAGINWLLGSRDGSLWMATYRTLNRLKDGAAFTFPIGKGNVPSIAEDYAGTIWVTRNHVDPNEGPLCRIVGNDLTCYGNDKSDGNPAKFGTALAADASGDIWFGCQMLCRWNGSSISQYLQEQMDHPLGDGVVAVAAGAAGSVWVATDGVGPGFGVRYYSHGTFTSYVVPGFDGATIRAVALFVDRQQTLWVGTESEGLYHVHDGHADHYGAAQGLTGNEVHSIYEDREGNLWITTDKGMDLFRDIPIVSFSSTEGLSGSDLSAVIARNDNSVWVGLKGALAIIRPDSVSLTTMAGGHSIQDVCALLEDRLGQVWVGINRTVMIYQLGKFFEIKGQDGRPLEDIGKILALTEDIDGNIWAVARDQPKHLDHLLRIKDHRVQEDISIASLVPRGRFLAANPAGGIWIGTGDGKLAHYLHGAANIVSNGRGGATTPAVMFSISVDSAGVVWGATNRGLYRWDRGALSVMDEHNGLPCSAFGAALMDRTGSLWLDGMCGYLRISAADLARWVAHPEAQVTVTTLGALDGAAPGWNADRIQPNAATAPDGRLWFVGASSLQMIDPGRSYKNPTPPPVHVEGLVADGKSYSPNSPIALPPLTRDLHIDYTALSFVMPQRMGFRYILEGRDAGWQDPGLRRQAFYSDLRPGSYRFRVIASNNDGVWNKTGATLDFKVAAAWYQTVWFRSLCLLVGVLLLWAIYRLRVRRIAGAMKARFDERLAERTRIARDLHDTFLQTIQGSKLVADDALSATTDLSHMRLAMEKLSTWLARATEEGRAALNSLRTSTTEVNNLTDAFRRALEECRIHSSMEVSLQVSGQTQEMHPIVRDEVYRIGYEAIRNACVHSHATQLSVELSYAQDLRLRIRDNGAGIDPDIVHGGKPGHFGLQSMRERTARIMGKFIVESSVGSGTVVTLTVPGGIIYRTVKT